MRSDAQLAPTIAAAAPAMYAFLLSSINPVNYVILI